MPEHDPQKHVAFILQQIFDPTSNLNEKQKAEYELITFIASTFNDVKALRRMADMAEKEDSAEKDKAEIFASGLLAQLEQNDFIVFQTRLERLYVRQLVAHWFRTFETYILQGEV